MFLNKLAVCLYRRVAVRGKIFEPNGFNEKARKACGGKGTQITDRRNPLTDVEI